MALAAAAIPAFGVLTGSPSKFESNDGNMVVDTTGNHDWSNVSFTPLTDLSNSNSDSSFTSGQKQDTTCPDVSGHKNPPKDDFTNVAKYSELSGSGDTFLYGATVRYAANGNASENVELNQGTSGKCASGLYERTAGDRLITIDYTGGGTSAQFHVLKWITSGACFVSSDTAPCWGASVQSLDSNQAEGEANQSAITTANNPISSQDLAIGQFAEFGINLSAGTDPIIPNGSCSPFAQTIWESRSSGSSFVSTTKDIVIDTVSLSNCGEIKIVKNTDPRNIDHDFNFTSASSKLPALGTGTGCGVVDSSGNFCLNDGTGKTNSIDETNLKSGTYTVTESSASPNYTLESLSCTPSAHTSVSGSTVTINLAANDNITCTYQNKKVTGAISIAKSSSKDSSALSGAHFELCTNNGPYTQANPCTPAATGSGDLVTGTDGTACVQGLDLGDYYVTETQAPSKYKIDDSTTHKETISSGSTCASSPVSVSFTDTPLTGAIQVTKVSTKSASTVLPGASFEVCTNNGPYTQANPCAGEKDLTTDATGTACVDGLALGTYYITETQAPSGYSIKDDTKQVTVDASTGDLKCSDATFAGATATFADNPLTDLTVEAKSEVTGGTKSQISCTDASSNDIGHSANVEDAKVTSNGLKPGTYTCTVVVDP